MNILKKIFINIPRIKKYLNKHNPSLDYLADRLGLLNGKDIIVLDVGANRGQSIDWVLSKNQDCRIYSFEPTPDLAQELQVRYKLNQRVNILNMAVSDFSGTADFYVSKNSGTNSLLKPNIKIYNKIGSQIAGILDRSEKIACKVDTIDNWIENIPGHHQIALLKTDTQGNDYRVLKSAQKTLRENIKAVVIELQYLNFYQNSDPFFKSMEILYLNKFFLFSFFENIKIKNIWLFENNALFLNQKYYDINRLII